MRFLCKEVQGKSNQSRLRIEEIACQMKFEGDETMTNSMAKCLTSELLKAKCRELNLQTAKCRSTMECRTPTEAQKQPNSSEANQALLLEKDSTNFLAVGYRGSDEIDHPVQKSGREDDRRALGFKTCPMCRLAATNSSMIS